jgi:hypothetical protein
MASDSSTSIGLLRDSPKITLPKFHQDAMSNWGGAQPLPYMDPIKSVSTPASGDFTPMDDIFGGHGGGRNAPGLNIGDPGFDTAGYAEGAKPEVEGEWLKPATFGLGVAKVGLGVYNALEQTKMNEFMRGYYGDQMELQQTDFANAAQGSNEALAAKQGRILSSQGMTTGTDANKKGVAEYMDKWGAQETV